MSLHWVLKALKIQTGFLVLKDKTKQNVTTDEDGPPWFVQYLSPHFVTTASRHTWNLKYSGNLDAKSPKKQSNNSFHISISPQNGPNKYCSKLSPHRINPLFKIQPWIGNLCSWVPNFGLKELFVGRKYYLSGLLSFWLIQSSNMIFSSFFRTFFRTKLCQVWAGDM